MAGPIALWGEGGTVVLTVGHGSTEWRYCRVLLPPSSLRRPTGGYRGGGAAVTAPASRAVPWQSFYVASWTRVFRPLGRVSLFSPLF